MKLCFQSQNICYNIINFFSSDHYLVSYTIASLATEKLNSKEKYFNEKSKVARYLEQKMDVQGPTIKKNPTDIYVITSRNQNQKREITFQLRPERPEPVEPNPLEAKRCKFAPDTPTTPVFYSYHGRWC